MQRHGCYGRPAFQLRMCQTLRPSHATSCNVQTRRRFGLIPTRASALVRPSAVWGARWADHRPGRDPQATRPGCVAPLGRRHPFVLAARLGGRRCGRPAIARRGLAGRSRSGAGGAQVPVQTRVALGDGAPAGGVADRLDAAVRRDAADRRTELFPPAGDAGVAGVDPLARTARGNARKCSKKDVDDVKEFRQNSAPSTQVEGPTASSTPGCGAVGASESLRE